MGCDIHALYERQHIRDYGTGTVFKDWECAGQPDDSRHYAFFGALAGVRREDVPVCTWQPFFIAPDGELDGGDACEAFRAMVARWSGDGHTYGSVTLKAMQAHTSQLLDWAAKQEPDLSGLLVQWEACIADMQNIRDYYKLTDDQVRLVFFFDN